MIRRRNIDRNSFTVYEYTVGASGIGDKNLAFKDLNQTVLA